ncbi:MAG: hypothetical protein OEL83_13095 [Desulforhopalus sp.]|nr:hypothetical protein [Desulforhopalus sp.]
MPADTQALASALATSIRNYQNILGFLVEMDREIGIASDTRLQSMTEILGTLQIQAVDADKTFLAHFDKESAESTIIQPLMVEREKVIAEILRLNSNVQKKAMGIKSLLAHELGALRLGKTAHYGYKSQQASAGRIVDSTS